MRIATIFLILIAFSSSGQSKKPITLGEAHEIISRQLSETRTLNIYLPVGYNSTDTERYPVIYLLDGGLDEDFIHVVGLVQFNSFPWVNRVPRSIVVGITNTNRERDMTYPTTIKADKTKFPSTGGSEKFIAFIEKEVQPYINKTFRTNGSKTIIGESLGGLLATEILLTKPYMFDRYIIISPSLWWDNGSLLNTPVKLLPKRETGIYIGVGKEGLTPGAQPHVMEVDANLLHDKIKKLNNKHTHVFFDYLPEENHATVAHQAVLNAFRLLYPSAGKN
jgi:predicted alpha/beta superfamily hydrolase